MNTIQAEEALKNLGTISDHFFTVAEIAGFLRISYCSAWRLIISGKITASKIGGQWRIPRQSIVKYLKGNSL